MTRLEHVNVTVPDPAASAALFCRLFGWHIRWQGPGMTTGRTVHVGDDQSYVALFTYGDARRSQEESFSVIHDQYQLDYRRGDAPLSPREVPALQVLRLARV